MKPLPIILSTIAIATLSTAEPAAVNFNRDIRPILSENCFHCHGPDEHGRKAKLRLDTPEGAYADHKGVRAIVPGDLKASEVAYRIRTRDADDLMPPADSIYKLSEEQKALLEQWIKEGAEYQGHWAFTPPVGKAKGRIRDFIDAGVSKELASAGLKPSPQATRETLIRRWSLDLRGIPPALAEIDAFLADRSPSAWETVVDRMLASPQCAERLALDWLDVARYADTNGYSIDDHRDMWGWRDWVIHAFMQNKPYDQFLTEQLAGDLMPAATPEQKMATGFLRNSMNTHEGGTIPEEYRVAYLADKVDTVATTFMGLTLKCAQCHDHKYDPISMKDYYRFYAFFDSATERGSGAKNGNTAPVIKVASPLNNQAEIAAALQARLDRIKYLRNNLGEMDAERFAQWQAEVLAKAPPSSTSQGRATGQESHATAPPFSFPADGRQPEWIWAEKSGATSHLVMRKSISVGANLAAAYVYFTCDNSADLYANGRRVGNHLDPWMEPQLVDITAALKAGDNIVSADAKNAGGVAGFIAWVQLIYVNGKSEYLLTDASWSWKKGPASFDSTGGWNAPVSLGRHGVGPWNRLKAPGGSRPGPALAEILRKASEDRSDAENQRVTDEFSKQSSTLTKRFAKALSIEQGIIQKQLTESWQTSVMVMDAPGKRKTRMLMRGQYDQPGEEVSAGVPAFLSQLPDDVSANRLALAQWLVQDDHPLTARVAVNRYWQMIFGAGLVKTSEDFGSQGQWPSHPELLDELAIAFRTGGWDVKQLLKEIVLSKTYQQMSSLTPQLREKDPYNRLLARAPRTRLQAELVRDNALAISGLLVNRVGGPSVYPSQPDGLWRQVSHFGYGAFTAQAYFPDDGEPTFRRSMYTFWKRTAPPPGMAIFDAPTRETCTVRRSNTNTPLQALVLLNDPQYLDAARALARRMITDGGAAVEGRIDHAFRLATARRATAPELKVLVQALERERARFSTESDAAKSLLQADGSAELAAYTMVASTILNLNETITKQ
jgi:hypothetical protein